MKRSQLSIAAAAAAVTGIALFFGGLVGSSSSDATQSVKRPDVAATQLLSGFAAGDTDSYIHELEQRVAATEGRDPKALALLGLAYLQQVRETGDVSAYPRAEESLAEALRLDSKNLYATIGLAALAASRHRFEEARALAERAIALSPYAAAPYGILGDALVETGRYDEAFEAFDRMVALRPSASGYARISYARELLGDTEGALAAMRLAVEASGAAAEPAAWATVHLGNLQLEQGRLERAAKLYRHALARLPGYAPAIGGLARVEFLLGHHRAAIGLYRDALARADLPEFATGLGDAYAALGRTADAEQAWERAVKLEAAFAAYGGRNDLETALFDLDHGRSLRDALARAREGQKARPSVEGEHVLAWALYRNGQCEEARTHSVRALRLGTKDTGALLHRSLIERCLGNVDAAVEFRERALAVNPYALVAFGRSVP
jgi:tetratricopeptide (TPR) repeat protein